MKYMLITRKFDTNRKPESNFQIEYYENGLVSLRTHSGAFLSVKKNGTLSTKTIEHNVPVKPDMLTPSNNPFRGDRVQHSTLPDGIGQGELFEMLLANRTVIALRSEVGFIGLHEAGVGDAATSSTTSTSEQASKSEEAATVHPPAAAVSECRLACNSQRPSHWLIEHISAADSKRISHLRGMLRGNTVGQHRLYVFEIK